MRSEQFIRKYRLAIILIFPLLTLLFVFGLTRLQIEGDINDLIPADMPSRVQTSRIEKVFGSNELIVIVLESDDELGRETLHRVRELTRAFERRPELDRVTSLFTLKHIRNEAGMMVVDPAVPPHIPDSDEELDILRKELLNNPFVKGTVLSEDLRKTAILLTVRPGNEENELIETIDNILEEIPGSEHIHRGGLPVVNALIIRDISRDVIYLLPIGFLLMTLMLYFSFRELRGVILPFSAVLMSIIISFGLMPLLGWKISIVTILMPVILIAVANDYGIHLIAKYHELRDRHPDWNNKGLALGAFQYLKRPILVTGITTIFGILGLMLHIIVHARQLGILTSIGIVWAVLLSLFFIPAILSYLPVKAKKKSYRNGKERIPLLERLLHYLAGHLVRNPKKIILVSLILACGLGSGIFMLKIDGNVENFFRKTHPVKISSAIINEHFGGSQNLSVFFEGDILDPVILGRMHEYEKTLLQHADVGDVTSIVSAIREISRGLYDPGDSLYNKIPSSRDAAAQYLELYYMNGDPDDFEQLIDFDYRHAQMIVRINKADGYIIRGVVRSIEELTQNDTAVAMLGGHALITSDMNLSIVNGQ
ncbi:MAG: efflux RND transporter permease subunit, partial [Candidatus Marinimicrobia bacterium]|nr:efflux RND transporter permease subunit [Candidatus Neomarinimicrobiota bacterium]